MWPSPRTTMWGDLMHPTSPTSPRMGNVGFRPSRSLRERAGLRPALPRPGASPRSSSCPRGLHPLLLLLPSRPPPAPPPHAPRPLPSRLPPAPPKEGAVAAAEDGAADRCRRSRWSEPMVGAGAGGRSRWPEPMAGAGDGGRRPHRSRRERHRRNPWSRASKRPRPGV